MDLADAPGWIWGLIFLVFLSAIGVLVLEEINMSATWNYEKDTAATVIHNATAGIANVTKQLPTVGIIVGVLLIVGAVVMIAVYFGRRTDYV